MDIVRRPYGSLANLFETSHLGVIVWESSSSMSGT